MDHFKRKVIGNFQPLRSLLLFENAPSQPFFRFIAFLPNAKTILQQKHVWDSKSQLFGH